MLTAKLNLGALKAAALAASKELTRYYLNGVLIEVGPRSVTYVATNGTMLFAYRDALSERDADNMLLGHFIVPVAVIKSVKLAKRASEIAALRHSGVDGEEMTIKTADGGTYGFAPIDGTFPNWRAVTPRSTSGEAINGYDPKCVAALITAGKLSGAGRPDISPNGEQAALMVYPRNNAVGVIMPTRAAASAGSASAPAWAAPVLEPKVEAQRPKLAVKRA
jgi:DNA polymerase-3 subunit beta